MSYGVFRRRPNPQPKRPVPLSVTAGGGGGNASVGEASITLGAITATATGTLTIQGSASITLGAITTSATGYLLTNANVNGVLEVSSNGRYFQNDNGPLVLTGFHTWYAFIDGGVSDPPPTFDYDEWLDFQDARGGNIFKLWALETAKDWPDEADTRYVPLPFQRTGPGNAADGKAKFDLTKFNNEYFERLHARAIEAGNRGYYVVVQMFQGWHIDDKGIGTGDPWAFHPFENGNNINSIDGDTDNDGAGEETRDISNTAVYNIQKAYVEHVIDTLNSLDNVLWEISNEETDSANNVAWQHDLIDYIHTYESSKPKQHPVGMTWLWPGGDNADLDSSNADWISYGANDSTPLGAPPEWPDTSAVSLWDTDHMGGLVLDTNYVWRAFCQGHNVLFMDSYDGAFGDDWTANTDAELIRNNLGYIQDYAARITLANMEPQSGLSATGYCLANTSVTRHQYIAYQDGTGAFDLDVSATSGQLTVEWLQVSDGTVQAGSTISGGATRTLTPPWSGLVVAFLEQVNSGSASITLGAITTSATGVLAIEGEASITLGAITVAAEGTSANNGAASITLGAITTSATGTLAINGASSITLGAITTVATGVLAIEGEASITLGAITVTAEGNSGNVGSASITLGAVTVAATGQLSINGQAAITLGAITVNSLSTLAILGAATITLGAITVTATGGETDVEIATIAATIYGPKNTGIVYGSQANVEIGA